MTHDAADHDAGTADHERETAAAGALRIGMYHPKAGARSAGGVATYVQEACEALAARGPTVLYTEAGEPAAALRRAGVTVVPIRPHPGWRRLRRASGALPYTLADLSAQASESVDAFANAAIGGTLSHAADAIDVLFTHNPQDALFLSNTVDVPVVNVFHGCRRAGLGSKAMTALSRTAGLVANSPQTVQEVAAELGRDIEWVASPGVDVRAFHPARPPAFEASAPTVLFVGRFVAEKGVFDLLEAFARVESDAALRLVGRGNDEAVAELIDALGVGDAVTVEGEVPHDQLAGYYTAADVTCLPTHYESFGMVNLEAMACGTPVVTSDLPGIRAYATTGENARLVPSGDIEALAGVLDEVLASPDERERLGAAGRTTAERFTWEATADSLERASNAFRRR